MTWIDHCGWCGIELTGWNKDHDVKLCMESRASLDGVRLPTDWLGGAPLEPSTLPIVRKTRPPAPEPSP